MFLDKIVTISAGFPFREKISENSNSEIYAIQMKDISLETGINWQTVFKTNVVSPREPEWLQDGDILFAARGNHNYAILVETQNKKAVAAPHFFIIKVKSTKILPEFLVWQLNQSICQAYFAKEAEGSLTKSIRRGVLENTPIIIPTLRIQQEIIQLQNVLRQQQQIYKELIRNNQTLINGIAKQLLKKKGKHYAK